MTASDQVVKIGAGVAVLAMVAALGYSGGRRGKGETDKAVAAAAVVETLTVERAAHVDTVRVAAIKSKALHDTVQIVDTNRVEIPGPTIRSPPDTVIIPSVIVRRLVGDSVTMLAQSRLIVSDSGVIRGLRLQVKAVPQRHWYDNRVSIGPSLNAIVGRDGRVTAGVGISVQLRVIGWP